MSKEIKSQIEQLYLLLTETSDTYAEIGSKLSISASTVSKRAQALVTKYHLNPSILRTSKTKRYYAKYCWNIQCHSILYVTAAQVKKQTSFYCSDICKDGFRPIPTKQDIHNAYNQMSFEEVAEKYNFSLGMMARLFEQFNIQPEDFPENLFVLPAHVVQRQTQKIKQPKTVYSRTKSGFRTHLGFSVRSGWENNFCLYLMHKDIFFEYESEKFFFPEQTGARVYIPDFKLRDGTRIEVKGYLDSAARTKAKRLKKHYPEVFDQTTYVCLKPGCPADLFYKKLGMKPYLYYEDLEKDYGKVLKNWEN